MTGTLIHSDLCSTSPSERPENTFQNTPLNFYPFLWLYLHSSHSSFHSGLHYQSIYKYGKFLWLWSVLHQQDEHKAVCFVITFVLSTPDRTVNKQHLVQTAGAQQAAAEWMNEGMKT